MNAKRAMAMVEISANSRKLQAELSAAQGKLQRFASSAKKNAIDFGGKAVRSIGAGAGQSIGRGLAGGAASIVGDSVNRVMSLDDALLQVQLSTKKTDVEMSALRATIANLSDASGRSQQELAGTAQVYQDMTADAEGLTGAMTSITRASRAAFAPMDDITMVVSKLKKSMDVDASQMDDVLGGMIAQADEGSVSVAKSGKALAELAPVFAQFGVKGKEGANELFALLQVVADGSGSIDTAKESLESFMMALGGKATGLKKFNVRVFDVAADGTKKFRDMRKILEDIGNSKLAKDPELLQKALGSEIAVNAYNLLKSNIAMLERVRAAGGKGHEVIDERLAKIDASRGARVGKAKQNILNFIDGIVDKSLVAVDETIQGGAFLGKSAAGLVSGDRSALPQHFQETNAVKWGLASQSRAGRVYEGSVETSAKWLPKAVETVRSQGSTFGAYAKEIEFDKQLAEQFRERSRTAGSMEESIAYEGRAVGLENIVKFLQAEAQKRFSADLNALVDKLARVIGARPVAVTMDSTKVNKTLDNSPSKRNSKLSW